MRRQAAKPFRNFAANEKTCAENSVGRPTAGIFSMRNSVRSRTAVASICFSEINNRTSCPRLCKTSATASPGNRWPPVPPHAITTFIRNELLNSGNMSDPNHHLGICNRLVVFSLSVNVDQDPNTNETEKEIRTTIADERQRKALVRQH